MNGRIQSQRGEIYLYKLVSEKNVIIPPHFEMHFPQAFAIGVPKRLRHMYVRIQSQRGEIYLYKFVSEKNVIIPPPL